MKLSDTKLNRQRLRAIRKMMRSGPVSQAQISAALDMHRNNASIYVTALEKMGQVRVAYKAPSSNGRRSVTMYELTPSYLATVKPNEPEEQPQGRAFEIAWKPLKPTWMQRLKTWLFGRNDEVGA